MSNVCPECGSYWGCDHVATPTLLREITDDDIIRIHPASTVQATSRQPELGREPDTLYQHMRRIDAAMHAYGRPFRAIHISAAGYCQIEYGQHTREVTLLLPTGVDHRDWIDRQIMDLHDSGLVGPLCASYDEYECISSHILADGTSASRPGDPQPGDIRGAYYVWPYRCNLPGCQIPLDTTGKPMAPIGSRHDTERTREADQHAIRMRWVKRLPNGKLVCNGHPERH